MPKGIGYNKTPMREAISREVKGNNKIGKVMSEFKRGKLKSGSGKKVTDRDQAIAIAMSEAGRSKNK